MEAVIVILIIALVLAVVDIVLFFKLIGYKSGLAAYMRYSMEQGIKEPTAEKISEYQRWALEKMIKDFFKVK